MQSSGCQFRRTVWSTLACSVVLFFTVILLLTGSGFTSTWESRYPNGLRSSHSWGARNFFLVAIGLLPGSAHAAVREPEKSCDLGATVHQGNVSMAIIMRRAAIGSRLMLIPRFDGFGTQVCALLSALAYCKVQNLTYVHRKWEHVGHAPRGASLADWSTGLEQFTGLVQDEVKFSDVKEPVPAAPWIGFADTDRYFNSEFLKLMRGRYLSALPHKNNSKTFIDTRDSTRVAVHIRRGDVRDASNKRYTNITQTLAYMSLVERDIQSIRSSRKLTFHVYSEGKPEIFAELVEAFGQQRVFLHLDDELKITFHDMVSADVLIMAKSAFSYAVALLSMGKVYYQPVRLAPLKSWHVLPGD
jgi:hypothetical protein